MVGPVPAIALAMKRDSAEAPLSDGNPTSDSVRSTGMQGSL